MSHPDRKSALSPVAICGIIMAILLFAASPPLGLLAILFAMVTQGGYGHKRREDKRRSKAKALLAQERHRATAIRYMRS